MNKIDELKQRTYSIISNINLYFDRNKQIYVKIIEPEFEKIRSLFKINKYPEIDLNREKTLYDDLMETKISDIESFNNEILTSIQQNNLSIPYLLLLNSVFQTIVEHCNSTPILYIDSHFSKEIDANYSIEDTLFSALQKLISNNAILDNLYMQKIALLRAFELVKDTSEKENVVIIGANDSGKSSFSRNITSAFGDNIVIIAAQKIFQYQHLNSIPVGDEPLTKVRFFQQERKLCKEDYFAQTLENDMMTLTQALIADYIKVSTSYYEQRNTPQAKGDNEETVLERIFQLWHEIIPHRELFYDNGNIMVKGNDCDEYDFTKLSDGEKAVFYYAGHILLARENSYIIVDEPENHLNFSIVSKMWDILEEQRSDCTFMYLTHNINFATSRLNARKLWMKSFNQSKLKWDIVRLPDNNVLPEALYMELLGSKQKILFCEGNDNSSYDSKLYSILFPNYTIKPVGGHCNVISSVRAFNKSFEVHGNEAIGIIDSDFHDEKEIEAWKKDKIYSLPVCEIENIFLDEKLINEAIKRFLPCPNIDINSIKESLFSYLEKDVDHQAVIYTRDKSNAILTNSLIKEKENIANLSKAIREIPKNINPEDIFKEKKEKLQRILEEKDFEKLVKENNNKGLCAELEKLIVKYYIERLILMIREREDLQKYLKDKYFADIPES